MIFHNRVAASQLDSIKKRDKPLFHDSSLSFLHYIYDTTIAFSLFAYLRSKYASIPSAIPSAINFCTEASAIRRSSD